VVEKFDGDGVAAAREVFCMEGLVDIGDKVDEKAEGEVCGGRPVRGGVVVRVVGGGGVQEVDVGVKEKGRLVRASGMAAARGAAARGAAGMVDGGRWRKEGS